MNLSNILMERAHNKCELCSSTTELSVYEIPPIEKVNIDTVLVLCSNCKQQVEAPNSLNVHHWHCLSESMWSEHAPVQVMAYRLLTMLRVQPWAQDLLEQLYLDESLVEWAKAGIAHENESDTSGPTLDSNGTQLLEGDSVTLIKDLDVKGAGFTAKRGTLVKNIKLTNNPKHIEGRVNGIQIVLVADYLKKVI